MSLTDKINALTAYANGVTGESDTTLSEAVHTLADGYGQGGGDSIWNTIVDRTVTEINDRDGLCKKVGAYVFSDCKSLTSVVFPSAETTGSSSFSDCTNLSTVSFPSLKTIGISCFGSCTNLSTVSFTSVETVDSSCFSGCKNLSTASFSSLKSISGSAFSSCQSLKALILRRQGSTCYLSNASAFNGTPMRSGTGYIYVPASLIENYKTDYKWSTYAAQFRALEDYTVDGTITGELDPNKI